MAFSNRSLLIDFSNTSDNIIVGVTGAIETEGNYSDTIKPKLVLEENFKELSVDGYYLKFPMPKSKNEFYAVTQKIIGCISYKNTKVFDKVNLTIDGDTKISFGYIPCDHEDEFVFAEAIDAIHKFITTYLIPEGEFE